MKALDDPLPQTISTIEGSSSPNDHNQFSKDTKTVIVSLVVVLWVIYFCLLIGAFTLDTRLKPLFESHMGSGIAVPLAGLSSFLLVTILEISSGPIRFEGLGFKFSGAAGPVIFWVVCFLAIIAGIRLVPQ